MRPWNHIPNLVTLLNLASGSLSVILALEGRMPAAAWLILAAACCDFIDGLTARLLKAGSEIGAQLDSLADVVSFGLAPSVILYVYLKQALLAPDCLLPGYAAFFPLIVVLAAAYRLARFNSDPGQKQVFKGMPAPSAGIFVAALPLMQAFGAGRDFAAQLTGHPLFLLAVAAGLSVLMISRIPVMALKFNDFSWRNNRFPFILLLISVILIAALWFSAIPLIILLHVLASLAGRRIFQSRKA